MIKTAGLSEAAAYWVAGGGLVAALAILYAVSGRGPTSATPGVAPPKSVRGFWYLFLGKDNRVSTSKVQFGLWTLALAYALLVMILGPHDFPTSPFDPSYLLLLGFPAGAAVGASLITTGKIADGSVDKTPATDPAKSPAQAISEIVSDDSGALDLGDAQYFVFNLVALLAFFVAFAQDPARLPALPANLVALTSASAAAYLLKKSVSSDTLAITAVVPQRAACGTWVVVTGNNLCGSGYRPSDPATAPKVTVGGVLAGIDFTHITDDSLTVLVPIDVPPGPARIAVTTTGGMTSKLDGALEVTATPRITLLSPSSVRLGGATPDATVDIDGDGFTGPPGTTGTPTVLFDGRPVSLSSTLAPTASHVRVVVPSTAAELAPFQGQSAVTVTVLDPLRRPSATATLTVLR